ncbi:Sensor protein QseC [Roseovarius sp. THAF9]|uniref:ATP-binding protein n=1 Tax=Roseovarius sp. THAF9 TaxID=2587847 RepID=UPI001267A3C0|nr:ATP-binding protein [Roseovarius sp. THAF9]QFT94342.1 Sensor protein QseC [Roseovarius sp. THAF9]
MILALATGAVWLSAALWIQTSTRSEVEQVLDARLAEAAKMVSSLISDHRIEVARAGNQTLPIPTPRDATYSKQLSCQIWSLDGSMVGRSDGAPDVELTNAAVEGYTRSVIDGEPWRVYTLINQELGVKVMVGDSLAVRDNLARDVLEGLLLPGALVLPILAVILWISVARGLAPLDHLANALRNRSPSDLSPLLGGTDPREIKPVRSALNSLFERVASARDVERDFTTYAAHELKTPLSGLRTNAQVMRLTDDPKVREKALAAIERSVDRTDRMVRQLLELAAVERSEEGMEEVDLSELMRETVTDLRAFAAEREVTLKVDAPRRTSYVRTNPFLLQAALRNVIENAINASPVGEGVSVALRDRSFIISDEGNGIPPELLDRMQTRFTRGRGQEANGSGLGLSIVASAMERLGGSIEFFKGPERGQTVTLTLNF